MNYTNLGPDKIGYSYVLLIALSNMSQQTNVMLAGDAIKTLLVKSMLW